MSESSPVIQLKKVVKEYDGQAALADIDLDVQYGEFLTILGPSGCGKTTLLRLIAGFEPLTSGQIFLKGRDVAGLPPEYREVNTVFQSYALFPHLTVYNNVAFGLRMRKVEEATIRKRVTGWRIGAPISFPAGSSSAWPSPEPSSTGRRSCCSTNLSRPSITACASRCNFI
jgi:ABC-type Fe3+/spermidine/putrescine transport system ATPase subunit